MQKIFIIIVVIAAIALSACAPAATPTPKPAPAIDLSSAEWSQWVLVRLNGQDALPGGTMNFSQGGKVAGSTGCNNYAGTYTVNGNEITFSSAAMTMMACEESLMKQEGEFLRAMSEIAKYAVEGETLNLMNVGGDVLMELKRFDSALEGTKWIATGVNNGTGGVVTTDTTALITLEFKDGNITGTGSCNVYNATYETDGNNIKFGPVTSTMMACEDALMQQEQQYFAALANTTNYTIAPDKLEFRAADGALQVSYAPAQ